MGWSIGFDTNWQRDIGYGVPAECDHPECMNKIDRGLSYVCGGEPFGGEHGCGLYFCQDNLYYQEGKGRVCERCAQGKEPFDAKPDIAEWIRWKLKDASWKKWRDENPEQVETMRSFLNSLKNKKAHV